MGQGSPYIGAMMQEGKFIERMRNFPPGFPDWILKFVLAMTILSVAVLPTLVYTGVIRFTYIEFINGMAWQQKYKAQSASEHFKDGQSLRQPVAGTVPRGYRSYPYWGRTAAGIPTDALKNPLEFTRENALRGEKLFMTHCRHCHGDLGIGDGLAVGPGRLPAPLSLQAQNARDMSDTQLFHILTVGQNDKMPSLAQQMTPLERWALIHYVRALQRSQNPKPEDLKDEAQEETGEQENVE